MKIVDLRCAVIGKNPIVRIVTDEGISGYGEVEQYKPYLKPFVLYLREALIGEDPTDRRAGDAQDPPARRLQALGAAVSAIEMALWDIAGKAAGLPVYKLLGGKIRDRVRVYNGAVALAAHGPDPEDYADEMRRMKALPEGFTIVKQGIAFHSPMKREVPDFVYGEMVPSTFHAGPTAGS